MNPEIKPENNSFTEEQIAKAVQDTLAFQIWRGNMEWDYPIASVSPFVQKVLAKLRGLE